MNKLIVSTLGFGLGFLACLYGLSFANGDGWSSPVSIWRSVVGASRADVDSISESAPAPTIQNPPTQGENAAVAINQAQREARELREMQAIDTDHPPLRTALSAEQEHAFAAHWAAHLLEQKARSSDQTN